MAQSMDFISLVCKHNNKTILHSEVTANEVLSRCSFSLLLLIPLASLFLVSI